MKRKPKSRPVQVSIRKGKRPFRFVEDETRPMKTYTCHSSPLLTGCPLPHKTPAEEKLVEEALRYATARGWFHKAQLQHTRMCEGCRLVKAAERVRKERDGE